MSSGLRKQLDRLWPARRRQRAELPPTERLALWATVSDHDPALRAMEQMLDDLIEANAETALNCTLDARHVEMARVRTAVALEIVNTLESERAAGKAWAQRKETE